MPRIFDALARLMPRRTTLIAETKASRTGPLVAFETLGRPVWTPRDYAAFAREGFMQNAVVYRSVRMVAEAAASVPLLLYEGGREVEDHPLLDLMSKPSADHTGTDFLEAWYGYLLVSGNAYAEAVTIGGEVRELFVLRPDRMKVIPGHEGWPEGYEYTAGGQTVRFVDEAAPGVRPILHMRLFHPANDHYGMSPIEAAAIAIDIHNTASAWNKALLDNSARPSGALVYAASDGRMTTEQFERLKSELETSYTGAKQAGRPLLLEGGLDWKPLALSPKDMDFIEAKNSAAREIALAIGVPPMLLGIPGDNTYSNYQEAQRAFWRQTVLPLVGRTAKALSGWLSPAWGMPLQLTADLDQIEALTPEREALWARMERTSFLTANEKRAAVGYDAIEEPPLAAGPPGPEGPFDPAPQGNPPFGANLKYSSTQPRVSAGNEDGGQWTDGGGGTPSSGSTGSRSSGSSGSDNRVLSDANPDDEWKPGAELSQNRGRRTSAGPSGSISQETRLEFAVREARRTTDTLRQLDPHWRGPASLTNNPPQSIEAEIARHEETARAAQSRLDEILRDAIPSTNPVWGVSRLRKELNAQGYTFSRPTESPGHMYENQAGAQVRIMERSSKRWRADPEQKHWNQYYYRYRPSVSLPWGRHTPIPDKDMD